MASRPKFRKLKAFRKAIIPALGAYLVARLNSGEIDLGDIVSNPGEQLPMILGSLAVGMVPVIVNVWKNREMDGNPLKKRSSYPSGYMWLAALAIPVAALSGCVTTTHPDGTITQAVDIDTAWAIYERYQMERARLEAEKAEADAARRAEINRDLARLAPLAEQAWRDIVRLGGS